MEVSREQVNSSSYQVTPRTATVGIATDDPNAYNEIMAAVATNNIDHVKNVVAALAAAAAPPAVEAPAAPPAEGAAPPAEQHRHSKLFSRLFSEQTLIKVFLQGCVDNAD